MILVDWPGFAKNCQIIILKFFTNETIGLSHNKLDVLTWVSVNTGVGPFSLNQVFPAIKKVWFGAFAKTN